MAEYAYQKKAAQEVRTPKVQQADLVRFHSVPNSLFVGQDDRTDSNLGAVMRERVAALQRQIPSAEREADRLSQGITATTPEGVRQQMGEKLGADFSNVRMYTDQSAANKADRMGAKAYTSGQNVYFGSGGFVPQVAAHELVHTVQQGAVESVGVQQSVSFGTVQMCPEFTPQRIDHIKNGSKGSNHKWELLVPDKSWDRIKEIIMQVMEQGERQSYGRQKVFIKTAIIEGHTVQVTYAEVDKDGSTKTCISDAWVVD